MNTLIYETSYMYWKYFKGKEVKNCGISFDLTLSFNFLKVTFV